MAYRYGPRQTGLSPEKTKTHRRLIDGVSWFPERVKPVRRAGCPDRTIFERFFEVDWKELFPEPTLFLSKLNVIL